MNGPVGTIEPVGKLTRIEHPGDAPREEARAHFGPLAPEAELCYCGACNAYYVADPYPQPCPGCDEHGVRVDTIGYYYAFRAAHD